MHSKLVKLSAPFIWLFIVGLTVTFGSVAFVQSHKDSKGISFGLYSSKTLLVPESTYSTDKTDPRVLKIEKIFDKFHCPLAGYGNVIVAKADEHQIPYWVVPAVSFQESSCGKRTPKPAGIDESYNAWGYGVWGGNVKTFANWEAGITAVTKYFSTNFFAEGVTDFCEMMKTYTPPSKGSWCEGVNYFANMIDNFETE
ncbi:MAG: hypothetical protein UW82_C0026G0014 [candidate division WWE3 bacterium GW2011_GWC2_44_9]|uniref:Mannosyl-glycoprotein endo-beta-N-acetylglucosamidase-like domain-containing protein n=2 Tax=Katanobacteria TaxID=422282 RepID=A0A0G1KL30_UNCKA|nr:MAG: hypothetical protein UW36_C0006G0014 [candidate division WWE3 bacterium GW2011_GWA2_44_16]KKT84228.1 MAG: hypothetical protein UW82_C0026G0014 [candidate division WWE3 bacterium GW2011_GWC2_44_9]